MYEPDGTLREVRPVGSNTVSPPGDVHTEGGGPEGGVVHYSVRGSGMWGGEEALATRRMTTSHPTAQHGLKREELLHGAPCSFHNPQKCFAGVWRANIAAKAVGGLQQEVSVPPHTG
jgi:hypothetical protein